MGKFLSEVKRAYLAGLIDGDGAIMAFLEKHSEKRFGFRVRIEIKITQQKKEFVEWLPKLLRIGYLRQNLRTYEWIVRDQKAAKWLLKIIAPYSHLKKQQIKLARMILDCSIKTRQDLKCVARLADTLAKYNIRSKNRRKNFATMI